jgi:hypothetical protein
MEKLKTIVDQMIQESRTNAITHFVFLKFASMAVLFVA